MYHNVKETYQQSKFFTASPAMLILMCYEGVIGNLKMARDAYAEKDYQAKAKALQKAVDILYELNASLDLKKGGAIASNLRSIYIFLVRSLMEADLKADLSVFDKSIALLEGLASSWREIARPVEEPAEKPLSPVRSYNRPGQPSGKNMAAAVA
jgi:flagellar protein FliS